MARARCTRATASASVTARSPTRTDAPRRRTPRVLRHRAAAPAQRGRLLRADAGVRRRRRHGRRAGRRGRVARRRRGGRGGAPPGGGGPGAPPPPRPARGRGELPPVARGRPPGPHWGGAPPPPPPRGGPP